jgi:transcriptional regulator with XRE-family HTH domain
MNRDWLWDSSLSDNDVVSILSDIKNPEFIPLTAKLLSRKGDAKEVFADFIKREDFLASWLRIRNEMKKNQWGRPKIHYWSAIYHELKKYKDILQVKEHMPQFDSSITARCAEIGSRIKREREEKHLTQKAFAQKLRVSQQLISKIESGRQNVSIGVLQHISQTLGIPFETLISGNERNENFTTKTMPFLDIPPDGFEVLVYNIVMRDGFENPQHFGGVGDKGRDIVAYKYDRVGKQEKWYFQCKRYKKIEHSDFKTELDKLKQHSDKDVNFKPDVIVFATACPVMSGCRDRVADYAKTLSFDFILFWTPIELEEKARRYNLEK